VASTSKPIDYTARVSGIHWLSPGTFELAFERPAGFTFSPGQRLRVILGDDQRKYSLISAPDAPHLRLCIRRIEGGKLSAHLSKMAVGGELNFSGPCGYFTFKPSKRPAVFVATGTGIAPFVAMVRGGVSDFMLLHGVRHGSELYYKEELAAAARRYIPCISEKYDLPQGYYAGRVTEYIKAELAPAIYDFYLCGSGAMIRDAVLLVDDLFAGSYVFTEEYFSG
jgi:ferredoxin-NADP reductase